MHMSTTLIIYIMQWDISSYLKPKQRKMFLEQLIGDVGWSTLIDDEHNCDVHTWYADENLCFQTEGIKTAFTYRGSPLAEDRVQENEKYYEAHGN